MAADRGRGYSLIVDGDGCVIVVALVEKSEATLKYIEQTPDKVLLIPANAGMAAMAYRPEQIEIQGVLVGQMRRYRSLQAK